MKPYKSSQLFSLFSKRKFTVIFFGVVMGFLSNLSLASSPSIFLSNGEIEEIHSLIFEKKSVLHNGEYQLLITKANRVLKSEAPTVANNKSPNGKNYYFTEGPYCGWFTFWGLYGDYCRDGQINPNANREDYRQAGTMGVDSVILALAYRLSGKQEYLTKLFEYIDTWIVQPESRMAPQFTNGQSRIEIATTHTALFYGISLVMQDIQQRPELNQEIQNWAESWSRSVDSWQAENNFEDWRLTMRLAIFSLLGNKGEIAQTVAAYKARISLTISDEGKLIHELSRTKSLSYSLYALNAMTLSAEIAYHQGIDLYHFKDDRGIGLEKALQVHAEFLLDENKNSWPHEQIAAIKKSEVAIFELANKRYEDELFSKLIAEWSQPFTEIRALQNISLTHSAIQITQQ